MKQKTSKEEQILIRITGQDRPGLTAAMMSILARYDAQILDIGQADIHSTLSLGVLIRIDETHSGQVMKELLFKATELSVNIGFSPIGDDEYEEWVGQQGKNRYILMVMGRQLAARQIEAATRIITEQGLNIDSILRLTGRKSIKHPGKHVRACIEFSLRGEPADRQKMQADLMKLSSEMEIDFSLQKDDMYRRSRRLICFDMDSTLIQTECIDELAIRAGVGDQVKAITERAMRGEIDFKESFSQRVALLKGLDVSVMQDIAEHLPITEGADRLISVLKRCGYKIAILSGGFTYFGEYLQRRFGIDYVYANELEVDDNRPLSGRGGRRSPQGRAAEADSPGGESEPGTDHRRGRRSQRPAHDQRSRTWHRLPCKAPCGGQRRAEHQHHRPGRSALFPGLQRLVSGRAGETVKRGFARHHPFEDSPDSHQNTTIVIAAEMGCKRKK